MSKARAFLEEIYEKYNRRDLVSPDPLQFLYQYETLRDREIVALTASSLAYGRVSQILKSIETILAVMGESPYDFILSNDKAAFIRYVGDFKYRFTTADDITALFMGMQSVLCEYDSFHNCFLSGYRKMDESLISATERFISRITSFFTNGSSYLLPNPKKGSACKRFNLFLRWMIRNDAVDIGGWDNSLQSKLIIPLDTHMNNICTSAGITGRKNADLKAAVQITEWFKKINPEDPVKYDFALTRFGIRGELKIDSLLKKLNKYINE